MPLDDVAPPPAYAAAANSHAADSFATICYQRYASQHIAGCCLLMLPPLLRARCCCCCCHTLLMLIRMLLHAAAADAAAATLRTCCCRSAMLRYDSLLITLPPCHAAHAASHFAAYAAFTHTANAVYIRCHAMMLLPFRCCLLAAMPMLLTR